MCNGRDIPDLDDQPDPTIGQCNQTESIPYPTATLGGHLFDDGELRILKILIADHRRNVELEYDDARLEEEFNTMVADDRMWGNID